MRRWSLLAATLLLAASLAGCLGLGEDEDAQPAGAQEEPAPEQPNATAEAANQTDAAEQGPQVEVDWFNGSVQGMVGPDGTARCFMECDNTLHFEVGNDTQALLVEMAWEEDTPMRLSLWPTTDACEEDCPVERASSEEGHVSIRLDDPEDMHEGTWEARGWAEDSPLEPVGFTIVASTFDQAEMPADYAKLVDEES